MSEPLTPRYFVEIRKLVTDEVIKRMGPLSEHAAEKVERGASINMNHEQFYTEIVAEDE